LLLVFDFGRWSSGFLFFFFFLHITDREWSYVVTNRRKKFWVAGQSIAKQSKGILLTPLIVIVLYCTLTPEKKIDILYKRGTKIRLGKRPGEEPGVPEFHKENIQVLGELLSSPFSSLLPFVNLTTVPC